MHSSYTIKFYSKSILKESRKINLHSVLIFTKASEFTRLDFTGTLEDQLGGVHQLGAFNLPAEPRGVAARHQGGRVPLHHLHLHSCSVLPPVGAEGL